MRLGLLRILGSVRQTRVRARVGSFNSLVTQAIVETIRITWSINALLISFDRDCSSKLSNKEHLLAGCQIPMVNEIVAACHKGDLKKVKNLVEKEDVNPEDPKWKDTEYGKTPLHWASHYGCLEVVKYLVKDCGCDEKCRDDKWGNTPLHWAARFANLQTVK